MFIPISFVEVEHISRSAVAKQQAESTNKQSKQLTLEDLLVEHLGAKCR
jgi:hypothetical protein